MKITASKRDDILKRKQNYEDYQSRKKQREDAAYESFENARDIVFESIISDVKKLLEPTSIQLDITCTDRWGEYKVTVSSNEYGVYDKNAALGWRWSVSLDENGEIKKESSSWSGLQATTSEHIESLREILRILEALNNIDWEPILTSAKSKTPKWADYKPEEEPNAPEAEDFHTQLLEADIEEVIGKNVLIKGTAGSTSCYREYTPVYYLILRETPAKYEVKEFLRRTTDNLDSMADIESEFGYQHFIAKSKMISLIEHPIETIEF